MDLTIISIVGNYVGRVEHNYDALNNTTPLILASLGFFNTCEVFTRIIIDAEDDIIDERKTDSTMWIANSLLEGIVNDKEGYR